MSTFGFVGWMPQGNMYTNFGGWDFMTANFKWKDSSLRPSASGSQETNHIDSLLSADVAKYGITTHYLMLILFLRSMGKPI